AQETALSDPVRAFGACGMAVAPGAADVRERRSTEWGPPRSREGAVMRSFLRVGIGTTLLAAPVAAVAEPPANPAPTYTFSGHLSLVSDYRFRGISQTFAEGGELGPAIQGGVDLAHASGWYLGNWNSNVSGNQYPNGGSIEMDFYGGFKRA